MIEVLMHSLHIQIVTSTKMCAVLCVSVKHTSQIRVNSKNLCHTSTNVIIRIFTSDCLTVSG